MIVKIIISIMIMFITLFNYRKCNQKILELQSESEQSEERINEWKSKFNELQNQLQCEKDRLSINIDEKNTTISDKGF